MDATGAKPAKWPHSYAEQIGNLAKVVGWIADLLIPAEYHTKESRCLT